MIKVRPIGFSGGPRRLASMMLSSDPWHKEIEYTADVTAAAAKGQAIHVPAIADNVHWGMTQVSARWSSGATTTGQLVVHWHDEVTDQWHAGAEISLMDSDEVSTTEGQIIQFETPAGKDLMALQVTFDGTPATLHITVRGCAYIQMEM